ncbi:MAG TPA: pyridoxal-phosphate dependent enzyme, partial [Thalassobaculum sp.]
MYNIASLDGLFLRLQRNPPDLSAMMYTSPPDAVTLQAIYEAQRAIRGVALRTPLVPAPALAGNHREVRLKLETAQPTGAFKIRGAANAVARLPAEALRRG